MRNLFSVLSVVSLPLSRVLVAGVLAAGLGVSAASAETLTVGGRTLIIDPPPGYCVLDAARPPEAALIAFNEKMQQPRNHVVMQLANCDELAEFRAGKRQSFARYGQLFVPVSNGVVTTLTGYSRAEYLVEGARELPKLDSASLIDEVTAKLKQSVGTDVAAARFLGLLKQDDSGLYLGVAFGNMSAGDQAVAASAMGVVGVTLVNEVSVSLGLYQVNVGPEAVPGLLAAVQQELASLIQANAEIEAREAWPWLWHGIDLAQVGRGALIGGGLIGAAIAALGWLWSRRRKHP